MAVTDGAVTPTGHVAAEIKGELVGTGRDDADIAATIARILDWDVQISEGTVRARVVNGWVIFAGEVGYDFQRRFPAIPRSSTDTCAR